MRMDENDLHLDGNAAAGPLAEIFGREMTTADAVCAGCGAEEPVGRLLGFGHGMGIILRCPACDTALIRLARIRGEYWLDIRGARVLRIPTAN